MRSSIFKKFRACLLCTFAVVALGMLVIYALHVSQVMIYPSFCDIDGLHARIGTHYDSLVEEMGKPQIRETSNKLYALHYDGVTFFIRSDDKTVIYFDIVSEQYRLGGRRRHKIGIGSTREEVKADFSRRQANSFWMDRPIAYHEFFEPWSLPSAGFGFASSHLWTFVEFEFDQNDVVTRMRIGVYG